VEGAVKFSVLPRVAKSLVPLTDDDLDVLIHCLDISAAGVTRFIHIKDHIEVGVLNEPNAVRVLFCAGPNLDHHVQERHASALRELMVSDVLPRFELTPTLDLQDVRQFRDLLHSVGNLELLSLDWSDRTSEPRALNALTPLQHLDLSSAHRWLATEARANWSHIIDQALQEPLIIERRDERLALLSAALLEKPRPLTPQQLYARLAALPPLPPLRAHAPRRRRVRPAISEY
jgi:hypothetical protein